MNTILNSLVSGGLELENKPQAIFTQKMTKNYGSNRGINELDLAVHEGEVFGFLGPNGAGKTTTIRLLLNLIMPTSGYASIYGLDSQRDSVKIKKLIGYLPGEFSLYPNLTGAQTLKYFANLRKGVDWNYVIQLAERLELDLNKKFRQYSHGNKQKVGIIQALMHHPQLLIVDEPTTGLDPLNQLEFYKLVREVRDQGGTVFLSSHIMEEVEKTCDRIAIIREGKLVKLGNIAELLNLKNHYLEIAFVDSPPVEIFRALPGVESADLVQGGDAHLLRCVVRPEALNTVIKKAALYEVTDFNSRESSLEEFFLGYYRQPEKVG